MIIHSCKVWCMLSQAMLFSMSMDDCHDFHYCSKKTDVLSREYGTREWEKTGRKKERNFLCLASGFRSKDSPFCHSTQIRQKCLYLIDRTNRIICFARHVYCDTELSWLIGTRHTIEMLVLTQRRDWTSMRECRMLIILIGRWSSAYCYKQDEIMIKS